jgi:hypothetical protein
MREFSSILSRSYKYICSADGTLSDADLKRCHEYSKKRVKYPIDVVDQPCTVKEFKKIVEAYMIEHRNETTGTFMNTIITLDHSVLLKKDTGERDKFEMLYNLGETLTELKRKYPIAFVILSQLNRGVDSPDRNENGHYGNYILESDIFGADALLQHADTVIGLNRPGQRKISYYGPDRYVIENDKILVMHFLKCRNGDTRISFFQAQYDKMKILEITPPPTQEKRVKI